MANNGLRRQVATWLDGSYDAGSGLEAVANRLIDARVLLERCLTTLGGRVQDTRPEGGPHLTKMETIQEPLTPAEENRYDDLSRRFFPEHEPTPTQDSDTFTVSPEDSAMVAEVPWNPAFGENFQD